MRGFAPIALLLALAAAPQAALSATLSGEVVGISDGDTITVIDADRKTHKIRLAGIDAPEKGQPFGKRSKESLSDMAYRRHALIEWSKADRFGRIIGKIVVDGQDVCLEQVRQGLAWHYKKYESEQASEDRRSYSRAEIAAREAKVGLWADQAPTPPWDWRKAKRPESPDGKLGGLAQQRARHPSVLLKIILERHYRYFDAFPRSLS
jgi:endonuclease YncB( thermonuclease family)